jgi:alkanesulfonate monooxygenase SsuD/methylene tetrahydromethanopterin reductase-like flavin-dependent oxidoreductase (luciferase family)
MSMQRPEPDDHQLRAGLYLSQIEHIDGVTQSMVPTMARAGERSGFDDVFLGEHIALGANAARDRSPDANVRDFGGDWGQPPTKPYLEVTTALAAVSSVTESARLCANAYIAPLRNPLVAAKSLASLDVLSEGRLRVTPVPSWQPDEFAAAGVDFSTRGRRLDDMLGAWHELWGSTPASFESETISFTDMTCEPKPVNGVRPTMWFGAKSMHPRFIDRIVKYGSGMCPLFLPSDDDRGRLADAMSQAGRDIADLELISGVLPNFTDKSSAAAFDDSLSQIEMFIGFGVTTFFVAAGAFVQSMDDFPAFCDHVVNRFDELR